MKVIDEKIQQHTKLSIIILCLITLLSSSVAAQTLNSPEMEKLELSFSENPEFNKPVELTLDLIPPNDSKGEVTLKIELPEGFEFVSGDLEWQGHVIEDTPVQVKAVVRPVKTGDWTIKGWLIIGDDYSYEPLFVSIYNNSIMSTSSLSELNIGVPAGKLLTRSPSSENTEQLSTQAVFSSTIIGTLKYVRPDGSRHPIRYARVEIILDSTMSIPIETWTNNIGEFSVSATDDDGEIFSLKVYADTDGYNGKDAVNVRTETLISQTYYSYVNNVPISSTGSVGTWEDDRGCWAIYDVVINGSEYLYNNVNDLTGHDYDKDGETNGDVWNQPKIKVYWPKDSNTFWQTSNILPGLSYTIHIKDGDQWTPDPVLHEYGHAAFDKIYGESPPETDCPSPHIFNEPSGIVCALSEGWAGFFSSAVRDESDYRGWFDLETDFQGQDVVQPADQVEAEVYGILWDIFDNTPNEANDSLYLGISPIWDVLINKHPTTVHDFWNGWDDMGYNELPKLGAIYENHGIDKLPPTITYVHTDPTPIKSGKPFDILATISDPSGIASQHAVYQFDSGDVMLKDMAPVLGSLDKYNTSSPIQGPAVGTEVKYGICARDNAGNHICDLDKNMKFCPIYPPTIQSLQENAGSYNALAQGTNCEFTKDHSVIIGCTDTEPPGQPTINSLASPDYDGEYTVSWAPVNDSGCAGLKHYELEETSDSGLKTTYNTTQTGYLITGKGVGTYTYRVRAWVQLKLPLL